MTNPELLMQLLNKAQPHLREVIFHSDGSVTARSRRCAPVPSKWYSVRPKPSKPVPYSTQLILILQEFNAEQV